MSAPTPETWIPPSGSKLALGETCPASLALPRVKEEAEEGGPADIGTGIHAFIEDVAGLLHGQHARPSIDLDGARSAALALIEEGAPHLSRCEALDLAALDLGPDDLHEVGFSLSFEESFCCADHKRDVGGHHPLCTSPPLGAVTCHGTGHAHGTIAGAPGVIVLVADRVTDRPDLDRVDVDDWKSGYLPVPVKGNLQLLAAAVCAARHFGRSKARIRIVKLPEDGNPRAEHDDLDAMDLDLAALRLATLVDTGREQVRRRCAGEPLSYVQSKGCRYCPSFTYCLPSQAAIVAMAREPLNLESEITGLIAAATDEDAAKAFEAFEKWDAVAKRIRVALVTRARTRPIPFADGTVYGEREVSKTKLDGERVFAELAASHGPEIAALSVKKKATKKGIRAAAKIVAEKRTEADRAENPKAKKTTITAAEADLHALLEAQGAAVKTKTRKLDRHKLGEAATDDDDE